MASTRWYQGAEGRVAHAWMGDARVPICGAPLGAFFHTDEAPFPGEPRCKTCQRLLKRKAKTKEPRS